MWASSSPPCGLSQLGQAGMWLERSLQLVGHIGVRKHFPQKPTGLIWPREGGLETVAAAPKDLKGPQVPWKLLPHLMMRTMNPRERRGSLGVPHLPTQ